MIKIRALQPTDERKTFHSGNMDLDRFFIRYAGQNQFRHHLGTTYVAVDNETIQGFATVAAAHIEVADLPKAIRSRFPQYPLPVLRLVRLAVDQSFQGLGIGRALLKYIFYLAWEMSANFGCVGVVVDAKPEAIAFYSRYGFEKLEVIQGKLGDRPEPTPMFLALRSIPKPEVPPVSG